MADCVTLLRRKVQDTSLAVRDETMNSVITLATIEVRLFPELSLVLDILSSEPMADLLPLSVWQGQYQSCRNAC